MAGEDIGVRLLALERALERLLARMAALEGRVAADEQQLNKLAQPPQNGSQTSMWGTTGTTGFAAGSLASPSSASVTVYPDGPTGTAVTGFTAYSVYGTAVAANKTALYGLAADGKWYVVTADC